MILAWASPFNTSVVHMWLKNKNHVSRLYEVITLTSRFGLLDLMTFN